MNQEELSRFFLTTSESSDGTVQLRKMVVKMATRGQFSADSKSLSGWIETKLGKLIELQYGKNLPAKKRDDSGSVPVYGSNGIVGVHNEAVVDLPCIVVGRKGSSGALNISRTPSWPTDVTYFVIPPSNLDLDYSYLMLKAAELEKLGKGIKPGLSRKEAYALTVTVPPLPEQKRIVAKVDELMALIDDLEDKQKRRNTVREKFRDAALDALVKAEGAEELKGAWRRIGDTFDIISSDEFDIAAIKSVVLQLAVSAKLTNAKSSDESASELIEKIIKETSESSTHKKFAKRIKYSYREDEIPYDIPSSWKWARLGSLCHRLDYGLSVKSGNSEQGIPILGMGHIHNGRVHASNLKRVSSTSKGLPDLLLKRGDILFNRTNSWELVGKSGLYSGKDNEVTFASYLIRIRLAEGVLPEYINFVMAAPYFRLTQIEPEVTQQTNQANFNGTKLANCMVPLPPLTEQERIVAMVKELIKICDDLAVRLKDKEELGNRLAEAVVAGA